MDISGTLHLYSGDRYELFFVFDDDIAQQLYGIDEFEIDDLNTRRVFVSVGEQRFIHRRTLSFSKKQTEIKVSLCSLGSKNGLGTLTALYDWFRGQGAHPSPFAIVGSLNRVIHNNAEVWELSLTEPAGLITPPGLARRRKRGGRERRFLARRRQVTQLDLAQIGRPAEQLALEIVQGDFPAPQFSCLWRDRFLDSERIEIRQMGIIADIDVWNAQNGSVRKFVEVKAQKVVNASTDAAFFLSVGEWRSYKRARRSRIPYEVWLFQYRDLDHFENAPNLLRLRIFTDIDERWFEPDGYLVSPVAAAGALRGIP
jgi:hypothetical protein